MHWRQQPIHIIDFEGSPRSGIVEYAVVSLLDGNITATQTRLCSPTGEIDSISFAHHGIHSLEASKHSPFSDEWELFNNLRQNGVLAAHHASVEHGFLRNVWHYPSSAPDFLNPDKHIADWGPWLDTRRLAETVYPELKSYTLTTLTRTLALSEQLEELAQTHCPTQRNKPHCALYDCLASALILFKILSLDTWKEASLSKLLQASASSKQSRQDLTQRELF